MMESISARQSFQYQIGHATSAEILKHLQVCSAQFRPPLTDRVDLPQYAKKLFSRSVTFEAWRGKKLIGLVACYVDQQAQPASAFVSNVSVLSEYRSQGIARRLMLRCHDEVEQRGVQVISLEVSDNNVPAIGLYTKLGYIKTATNSSDLLMQLSLEQKSKPGT